MARQLQVYVLGRLEKIMTFLCGRKPLSVRCVGKELPVSRQPLDTLAGFVIGQRHCPAFFDDLYRRFEDISASAFQHIAADIYLLEHFEAPQ